MQFTPFRVALLGTILVIAFQIFVVQGFGGNWTVLFCSGEKYPPPPDLVGKVYQFPDSQGFDGQFYLYIARDFGDERGTRHFIDNPSLRWLRVLIPGLASFLSFGSPDRATFAYIAVVWLFCFGGIWIASALSESWGYPALLGIAFLAIPSVPVSLDRMMTDIALVVALLGLVLAVVKRSNTWVYLPLVLAPLARETGMALVGGWVLFHLWRRDWKAVILGALSTLPSLAWFVWVKVKFGGEAGFWFGAPFSGIFERLIEPGIYGNIKWDLMLAQATDYLGALGIGASFIIAIALLVRGERSLLIFCAVVYTLGIACFAKEDMWGEAYSYSRTGGPVAVMLALIGVEQRRWWLVAPMLLALPRIALQYGSVSLVAFRNLSA